jgi:hypothetical protein
MDKEPPTPPTRQAGEIARCIRPNGRRNPPPGADAPDHRRLVPSQQAQHPIPMQPHRTSERTATESRTMKAKAEHARTGGAAGAALDSSREGRRGAGTAAPRRAVFEFAELLIGGGRERRRAEGGEEGVGGRRVKTARQRQRQRRGEGNESEMEKRQKAIGGPSRIRKEREGEEPRTCGPTWQREKTKAERDLPLTAAAALLRCLCQECVA